MRCFYDRCRCCLVQRNLPFNIGHVSSGTVFQKKLNLTLNVLKNVRSILWEFYLLMLQMIGSMMHRYYVWCRCRPMQRNLPFNIRHVSSGTVLQKKLNVRPNQKKLISIWLWKFWKTFDQPCENFTSLCSKWSVVWCVVFTADAAAAQCKGIFPSISGMSARAPCFKRSSM